MRAKQRMGDSYTDRLFQWMKTEEKLPIEYQQTIKPKVYKVKYDGEPFILKGYRRFHVIEKQVDFFEHWNYAYKIAARPSPFYERVFTLSKLGCDWALFERVEGRHADFSRHKERKQAVRVLHQFHRTTKGIGVLSVPKDPLYIKWENRLQQLEETKDVFTDFQKRGIYQELHTCMSKRLEDFSDHPWGEVEEKAWNHNEWLHGDVAHHNFIINSDKDIKLIDFDLLHTGPRLYDHIQLAQRFLPFVELRKSILLPYFPHVQDKEIWWKGVLVPADLIREWLYGYRLSRREEASMTRQIRKLEKAWETRKKFVRYAEHML